MDSNKVFSELKLIWSNTLSIGSTPSPKKQSLSISSAENIAGCDEQKSRGGQKYSSPFSSSCRIYRSAKVVQRMYKTLWKACVKVLQVCTSTSMYKYKYKAHHQLYSTPTTIRSWGCQPASTFLFRNPTLCFFSSRCIFWTNIVKQSNRLAAPWVVDLLQFAI